MFLRRLHSCVLSLVYRTPSSHHFTGGQCVSSVIAWFLQCPVRDTHFKFVCLPSVSKVSGSVLHKWTLVLPCRRKGVFISPSLYARSLRGSGPSTRSLFHQRGGFLFFVPVVSDVLADGGFLPLPTFYEPFFTRRPTSSHLGHQGFFLVSLRGFLL